MWNNVVGARLHDAAVGAVIVAVPSTTTAVSTTHCLRRRRRRAHAARRSWAQLFAAAPAHRTAPDDSQVPLREILRNRSSHSVSDRLWRAWLDLNMFSCTSHSRFRALWSNALSKKSTFFASRSECIRFVLNACHSPRLILSNNSQQRHRH